MLTGLQKQKLTSSARELVNQEAARTLVEPQHHSTGFWFGGVNVIQDRDGFILICGRYRNYGDSRTGVHSGERGLEAAIFRANSVDGPFEKIAAFSKADLFYPDRQVVSIEGVALHLTDDGIEFFENDLSQPLVGHFLPTDRVIELLTPNS